MVIKELNIHHLKEVAELESRTYPKEMCLGYEDYYSDFESNEYLNESLGVFENGYLKGYLIAFHKNRDDCYISDLVCPHPKMLLPQRDIGPIVANAVQDAERPG